MNLLYLQRNVPTGPRHHHHHVDPSKGIHLVAFQLRRIARQAVIPTLGLGYLSSDGETYLSWRISAVVSRWRRKAREGDEDQVWSTLSSLSTLPNLQLDFSESRCSTYVLFLTKLVLRSVNIIRVVTLNGATREKKQRSTSLGFPTSSSCTETSP